MHRRHTLSVKQHIVNVIYSENIEHVLENILEILDVSEYVTLYV